MKKYRFSDGVVIEAFTSSEAIRKYKVMSSFSLDKIINLDFKDIPKKLGLSKRISITDKDFNGITVYIDIYNMLKGTDGWVAIHFYDKEEACEFLIKEKKELNNLCALYDKCAEKRKSFLNKYKYETIF